LILILTTLFSLASTLGKWIARPASASRMPASETVEEQQAAIVYVRVMSWLSRLITHPAAHLEGNSESTRPAERPQAPTHSVAAHRLQLRAASEPSHPSTSLRKSSRGWRRRRLVCMRPAAEAVDPRV
jgi:hypothetical protein